MRKIEKLTGADRKWGYRVCEDGAASLDEAMSFLSCSRTTLWRLIKAGEIRQTMVRGKPVVCRRSMLLYLAKGEV